MTVWIPLYEENCRNMKMKNGESKKAWGIVAMAIPILVSGCAAIPIHEQGLASKANMGFSDRSGTPLESVVVSQIEPGTGIGNGGQAAGCVACR